MHAIKRDCISSIKYLLSHFPCVAVLGARQVGKTTLIKQVLKDVPFFDLERRVDFNRIERDPEFFLSQYNEPIIIDEAQNMSKIFNALRVSIDGKRDKNGRYLISGSASPDLLNNITESLAGRIAIFELSGFSLKEIWQTKSNNVYKYINEKNTDKILSLKPKISVKQLLQSCLSGSYPEPLIKYKDNNKAFNIWMENYFQTYIKRDIRNIFPGLNIQNYQRFISMLAGSSGQILNASEFARSLDVSQPTIKHYFQIANGTFIWRLIPSYQKNIKKRIIKMPRGHFRDSGLLNYILQNRDIEQLQNHPFFGRIWETFIIEELLKGFYNNLISVNAYYYRTGNGAEIDLILEGDFGILPIEIKSGSSIVKKRFISLQNFINEHNLPFGLLINNSEYPCWLSKNIMQLPANYL